ncbi:hypothetical protein OPQ81_011872 [Rhizoctonia solani]|nr:hypothetical protein OPQ81_011872 [Rhizoctonia solani]
METSPLIVRTSLHTFRIERVPWDNLAGQKLRDEQVAELSIVESAPGPSPTAENIALFLLALPENSDEPVACGALRYLEDGLMEIKRMYATPKSRGTGAALSVLLALEKYVRSLGIKGLKLETSILQPDAIR